MDKNGEVYFSISMNHYDNSIVGSQFWYILKNLICCWTTFYGTTSTFLLFSQIYCFCSHKPCPNLISWGIIKLEDFKREI